MIARLRRFFSAVHEARALRIENANLKYDLQKRDRIFAALNVDYAIVCKDRDQLLADKYKAICLGKKLREERVSIH